MKLEKFFQTRVGDGDGDDDDGDDGDGRISPEHPSPILHAPRDIISRKGKSLTPMFPHTYPLMAAVDMHVACARYGHSYYSSLPQSPSLSPIREEFATYIIFL